MLQDNITHAPPTNIKAIITGMILVFLIVHIGFHATYIKHFPEFTEFSWIHHIHGALMGSWVILLVLQPVLIYKRRFTVCLLYTSPSPRDRTRSRMPSSA